MTNIETFKKIVLSELNKYTDSDLIKRWSDFGFLVDTENELLFSRVYEITTSCLFSTMDYHTSSSTHIDRVCFPTIARIFTSLPDFNNESSVSEIYYMVVEIFNEIVKSLYDMGVDEEDLGDEFVEYFSNKFLKQKRDL